MMKVTEHITRSDIFLASITTFASTRRNLVFFAVLWLIAFAYLLTDDGFASDGNLWEAAYSASIAVLWGLLVILVLVGAQLAFMPEEKLGLYETHTFVLPPAELRETTAAGGSVHPWRDVMRVLRTPRFPVIALNARAGHVIPRRAFASQEAYEHFCSYAAEAWRGVR